MKSITKLTSAKLTVVAATLFLLAGCTGTSYNHDRTCSTDYLLVPALSVPAMIGACDKK